MRLLPFTAAFFGGRLVSYAVYAFTAAEIRESSVGDAFRSQFANPIGLAFQLVLIALVVGMTRVNWSKLLGAHRASTSGRAPRP